MVVSVKFATGLKARGVGSCNGRTEILPDLLKRRSIPSRFVSCCRLDLCQYVGGTPVVVGVKGENLAVFTDEDGGERMLKRWAAGTFRARGNPNGEKLLELGKVGEGGSGEVPVIKCLFAVAACLGCTITLQNGGGVVGGVEADAEKMCLGVQSGIGCKGLVNLGKVLAHARAVVGEWATGIDEGHEEHLTVELLKGDFMTGLIGEYKVRDDIARRGNVILHCGDVIGTPLGNDDDVFEPEILDASIVGVGEEGGGYQVAGVEF
jgi:hypothetical protein